MSLLNESFNYLCQLRNEKLHRSFRPLYGSYFALFKNLHVKPYSSNKENGNASEKMTERLRSKFPLAKQIDVVDISGGCGSMYEIFVESIEFKGLSMVKQHRLINDTLKEDIKQMHGLRIQTKVPE